MRRYIWTVMAAVLVLGAGVGTSYAYLTAEDEVNNEFSVSETGITITEEFDPPKELRPGQVITKKPWIVSSSNVDCYVRAMVRFSDSRAESFCEALEIQEGWEPAEDGYYYWKEKLAPGETTGALFETVRLREDTEKEELVPFELLVYAEAVQCGELEASDAWKTMDTAAANTEKEDRI
ncbi:MAG: SipW-dependent-type signal peptide-containing protein [Eubacteriales bacterium]|nr:SipW-dependent-type signal peptide-containing protein [Eubacteriales bacterium]